MPNEEDPTDIIVISSKSNYGLDNAYQLNEKNGMVCKILPK